MTRKGASRSTRVLARVALVLSLFALLWLVLFKLSLDIPGVFASEVRAVNLVPFADVSSGNAVEVVLNALAFLPFGVLLSVNCAGAPLPLLLAVVCGLSVAVELTQYAFAIGVTDITDVIANTVGGLLGLVAHRTAARRGGGRRFDLAVCLVLSAVLVALMATVLAVQLLHGIRRSSAHPPALAGATCEQRRFAAPDPRAPAAARIVVSDSAST